jgi:hypothetical protein
MRGLKVIVVDEPTRGVDVGAKSEIFALIDELAGAGLAVVMMTSEMPELLGLSIALWSWRAGASRRSSRPPRQHRRQSSMPPSSERRAGSPLARIFRRNEAALVLCLVVLIAVFGVLSDSFLTTRNLTNVLGQAALPLIAATGLALVVLSGEIDVSIGSLLGAVALPLVVVMNATGSFTLGAMSAVIFALLVGVVNGWLVAYVRLNSLIVTLGMLFVLRGGIYLYTGQRPSPMTSCWKASTRSAMAACSRPCRIPP